MDQDKDRQGQETKTTEESDVQKTTTTTETGFQPSERESDVEEKVEKSGDEVVGDLQDNDDETF